MEQSAKKQNSCQPGDAASPALHEHELSDFFENAAEGIHKVGPDGIILWANKAELAMLGYEPYEYIGHNITEFHADANVIRDILHQLGSGKTITNYEAPLRCKNGDIKHVIINSNVCWEGDKFLYTRCFSRDITDQKIAQAAMHESEAQLKIILDHALVYVARCDHNRRFQFVNHAYAARMGKQPEDFIGKTILEALGPNTYKVLSPYISKVLSGQRVEFDTEVPYPLIGTRVMSCLYEPEWTPSGEVCGWVGVGSDITERRRTEEAQVAGLMRLSELSSRLARTHDPHIMLGTILSTIAELHHTGRGLLSLYDPESGALKISASMGYDENFPACIGGMNPGIGACGLAFKQKRRVIVEDTERDPLFDTLREFTRTHNIRAIHSTPVLNRAGDCIGVLSLHFTTPRRPSELEIQFADICVRHAADFMERIKTEEALREADRRKDEFLATLAHELRNPLAPIKNALHIFEFPNASDAVKEEARKMMQRQVRQMKRLIDDLMDVSRVSQGKIELQKKQVTLSDVIEAAIEIARPHISDKNHALTITQPDEQLWLDADTLRLSQVFANLLNNAAKYTNEGGQLKIIVTRENNEAIITISDNGIGIPQKMLPLIFDMFVQVDNSLERTQGGLGIGLTLVKELAEMHGGKISARSEGAGKGSEFTLRLPLVQKQVTAAQKITQQAEIIPYRVLVVDDNEASAQTLGWTLELIGHEVELAHDAKSAFAKAKTFLPDVILLDIGLPEMNGYDACRELRVQPETKHTFIVAQTGWGQSEHRKRSHDAGFDHHLVKPIDMQVLKDLLYNSSERIARGKLPDAA